MVVGVKNGEDFGFTAFDVPVGKRLSVEHVSLRTGTAPAFGNAIRATLSTTLGGVIVGHPLDFHDQNFDRDRPTFVANQPLLTYGDPGPKCASSMDYTA